MCSSKEINHSPVFPGICKKGTITSVVHESPGYFIGFCWGNQYFGVSSTICTNGSACIDHTFIVQMKLKFWTCIVVVSVVF